MSIFALFALTAFALFNVLKVYSGFFFFWNPLSLIVMLNRINPSFLVYWKGETEFLTIEPMIELDEDRIYRKFILNNGRPTLSGRSCQLGLKCLAFVHWTLVFTHRKFLICDVQGRNINKALISWCSRSSPEVKISTNINEKQSHRFDCFSNIKKII